MVSSGLPARRTQIWGGRVVQTDKLKGEEGPAWARSQDQGLIPHEQQRKGTFGSRPARSLHADTSKAILTRRRKHADRKMDVKISLKSERKKQHHHHTNCERKRGNGLQGNKGTPCQQGLTKRSEECRASAPRGKTLVVEKKAVAGEQLN